MNAPGLRILEPASYKQRVCDAFNARGGRYDSTDTFHRGLADRLVERGNLQAGQRVLDVACGTGMVALPAALCVGAEGRVTALDFSSTMLAEAREKALHGGLVDHLDFLQADAEAVAFEERSFDRILCSSGMLYMQDPCGALRKFSGWLASGGELHFNTPQEPCVPAAACFYDLVTARLGIPLTDAARPLGTPQRIRDAFKDAGLDEVSIDESQEEIVYAGGIAEYAEKTWRSLTSNAIMTPLDDLIEAEQLDALKPEFMDAVHDVTRSWQITEKSLHNPYIMLWCSAVKPA